MQPGQALACGVPMSRAPTVTENLEGGSPQSLERPSEPVLTRRQVPPLQAGPCRMPDNSSSDPTLVPPFS